MIIKYFVKLCKYKSKYSNFNDFYIKYFIYRYFSGKKYVKKLHSQRYPIQFTLRMSSTIIKQSIFQGKTDRYQGITVFSEEESCSVEEFTDKLKNSMDTWKNDGKRGVWFKVHLNQCDWVPILVKNGFSYHHAKKEYVMLYYWLPQHESDNVPSYAHTMVGVGAVVLNESDQVLVVKEKYFYTAPMWKLPGGYVEPGENLVDAAIREVAEETGIQAEFDSLLTLRQTHQQMFGCTDIYVVMNLKALSQDIQKCEKEIAECKWMDIEEYLNHPHVHELNRFFVQKMLHHKKHNIKIKCDHGVHQLLKRPYTVYSVLKTDDENAFEFNK
ncbi:hypothetical protein GWI33_008507 [Rhynchophorus ferrugineus]|uniref:Nudix hydrolase domain-containing protein n=2 Tax=Rhynchophorus ferrugineus TaxID=354439 RepID=A0A834IIA0_RHYFE|nr:hypothetical protein GWI33_008507 [Rhynchophorus ferrugineus]